MFTHDGVHPTEGTTASKEDAFRVVITVVVPMLVLVVIDVTRVLAPLTVVVKTGKVDVKRAVVVMVDRAIVRMYRSVHERLGLATRRTLSPREMCKHAAVKAQMFQR